MRYLSGRGKTIIRFLTAKHVHWAIRAASFLILLVLFIGHKQRPHLVKGFYYWKNNSSALEFAETSTLRELQVGKLYVKFFEVDRDPDYGDIPIAKTQLRIADYSAPGMCEGDTALSKVMNGLEIIPTVFVKNEVLRSSSKNSLDSLADNISFLVNKYFREKIGNPSIAYNELQIDCDWTIKTKENYFYLLRAIKRESGKRLSCTLRLYPYKYPETMGVPPVDKVTLMCYNLLSPLKNPGKNSILDNAELESYLAGAAKYPLHLDIALPVFSWAQVYRQDEFTGMINPNETNLVHFVKTVDSLWYELVQDVEIGNHYLREGDRVKWEKITEKDLRNAIAIITKYVEIEDNATITFFHLDEANLKSYDDETLNGLYSDFAG